MHHASPISILQWRGRPPNRHKHVQETIQIKTTLKFELLKYHLAIQHWKCHKKTKTWNLKWLIFTCVHHGLMTETAKSCCLFTLNVCLPTVDSDVWLFFFSQHVPRSTFIALSQWPLFGAPTEAEGGGSGHCDSTAPMSPSSRDLTNRAAPTSLDVVVVRSSDKVMEQMVKQSNSLASKGDKMVVWEVADHFVLKFLVVCKTCLCHMIESCNSVVVDIGS